MFLGSALASPWPLALVNSTPAFSSAFLMAFKVELRQAMKRGRGRDFAFALVK